MNPSLDTRADKSWLARESQRWVDDGVISAEQRDRVLARYPDELQTISTVFMVRWLAWLVAASGVILLVAWNWDGLPHAVKLSGSLLVTLAAYGAAALAARRQQQPRRDLLAFAGALLSGAFIAALTDFLPLDPTNTWPLFSWVAVLAATAAVTAAPVTTLAAAAALTFWVMVDTGRPPLSWAFLAVFPAIAIALQRRTHWSAAGAASLAWGAWLGFTAIEVWRGSSSLSGLATLAAGAALDGWAHWPAHRRPAFARTTPALFLMIGGLAMLTGSALARSAPPALAFTGQAIPALVLIVAMAVVALWPWSPMRSRVAGALVIAWLLVWAIAAPATTPPAWWSWAWLVAASAGLVGLSVSAISEAGTTRDRGVLLAGIASMVTLVMVHLSGGPNRFGRSALILLVSGAALWWTTTGHRNSPDRPSL